MSVATLPPPPPIPAAPAAPAAHMPPRVARWYTTRPQRVRVTCAHCGRRHADFPAVMPYLAELDDCGGAQVRKHPGWDETGWLAWWQCPACERHRFEAVTEQQVAQWGAASPRGWHSLR